MTATRAAFTSCALPELQPKLLRAAADLFAAAIDPSVPLRIARDAWVATFEHAYLVKLLELHDNHRAGGGSRDRRRPRPPLSPALEARPALRPAR